MWDQSKAFHGFSHKILLKKLQFNGFEVSADGTLVSYFEGKSKAVFRGASISSRSQLHSAPQGSIVVPISFIIVMKWRELEWEQSTLYADDSTLLSVGTNPGIFINMTVGLLEETQMCFLRTGTLLMNSEKTQTYPCSHRRKEPSADDSVRIRVGPRRSAGKIMLFCLWKTLKGIASAEEA